MKRFQLTKFLVSFDFVGAFCVLANSFHNCIIYTVRSPRFKVYAVIITNKHTQREAEFEGDTVVMLCSLRD